MSARAPLGTGWADAVPEGWDVRKLKYLAEIRNSNVDKRSEEGEQPVRLCNYTDVYYNDRITADLDFMPATASRAEIERFRLQRGDVLITKDSESPDDIAVPAYVEQDLADVLCGYHLALVRPIEACADGRFLAYCFAGSPVNLQFQLGANGITRYGLSIDVIGSSRHPVPLVDEQRGIADHLDRKTAAIDELIRLKGRMIDLLTERRYSAIERAVTRGLDPDVAMRDGGPSAERLCPASWEVMALKRTVSDCRGGVWGGEPDGVHDLPCVRVADFDRRRGRVGLTEPTIRAIAPEQRRGRVLQRGDLVLEKSGGGEQQPVGVVVLYDHDTPAVCSNFIARMPVAGGCVPEFLYYVHSLLYARRVNVRSIKQTTGIQNLDTGAYLRERVPMPPLREQREIADHLVAATSLLDRLENLLQKQLDLLREYRQTLISHAVTGRVPVRGAAAV